MKKCSNCGYESQDGNFCPGCGGSLAEMEQVQQTQAEQPVFEYQQPVQQAYQASPVAADEEISIGDWMLTILLCAIPCVNLIMLFVWAFGNSAAKSKSNWAKANLIYLLISVVISVIMSIMIVVAGVSMSGMYY